MATKAISSGAIWNDNWFWRDGAVELVNLVSNCTSDDRYPATNLELRSRNKIWAMKYMKPNDSRVDVWIDAGSALQPTCAAIIDSNIFPLYKDAASADNSEDMAMVHLQGGTSTSNVSVTYLLYPYATSTGVMRYYLNLDTPTSGTAGAYRYWRFVFGEQYRDGYSLPNDRLEVGGLYVGTHQEFCLSSLETAATLPSPQLMSFDGQRYVDNWDRRYGRQVQYSPISRDEANTFANTIRSAGRDPFILDIYGDLCRTDGYDGAHVTNATDASSAVLGRVKGGQLAMSSSSNAYGEVKFQFTEDGTRGKGRGPS